VHGSVTGTQGGCFCECDHGFQGVGVPISSHFQETAVRWSFFDFLGCFEKKSSKTFALDCILTALVTFSPNFFSEMDVFHFSLVKLLDVAQK
jgi:hypothetical protein